MPVYLVSRRLAQLCLIPHAIRSGGRDVQRFPP